MRRINGSWLRERWLEVLMVGAFCAMIIWFGAIGASFVPKPGPSPTPPGGLTPVPIETPTPLPTPSPTRLFRGRPTPFPTAPPVGKEFDGQEALRFVFDQTNLGPRPTGSQANLQTARYLIRELRAAGWQTQTQTFTYMGTNARNIVAKAGSGPLVVIGARYDTRRLADRDADPSKRDQPTLGANAAASGVAVLLELARSLNRTTLDHEIWLVFFDASADGGLDGWDAAAGADHFAQSLPSAPEQVITVDTIGQSDQQIYQDGKSTATLRDDIWAVAAAFGYSDIFKPSIKGVQPGDHTPFLNRGWATVDITIIDYQYLYTTQDTPDRVSAASLERVGRVLKGYLESLSGRAQK